MKLDSNRNINKAVVYHRKSRSPVITSEGHSVKSPEAKSIKDCPVVHHEHANTISPIWTQNSQAEQQKDESTCYTFGHGKWDDR